MNDEFGAAEWVNPLDNQDRPDFPHLFLPFKRKFRNKSYLKMVDFLN